jgi:hypothetical protein
MMAVAGGEGVPVLELYREFRYMMALDIDVSGAISPPGMEKGALRVRLPVPEDYDVDGEYSLADYPVHEYHLLRLLDGLLQRNYSRSLEDLGLPTLRSHAAARLQGAAAPYLQIMLEGYLYATPGAEEALHAEGGAGEGGVGERAPGHLPGAQRRALCAVQEGAPHGRAARQAAAVLAVVVGGQAVHDHGELCKVQHPIPIRVKLQDVLLDLCVTHAHPTLPQHQLQLDSPHVVLRVF